MAIYLRITAHDPLSARDGRPFGLGIRMKSLDWLYPSVLAGAFRTMLGNRTDSNFDEKTIESLKRISISGPLPLCRGRIYLSCDLQLPFRLNMPKITCMEPAILID